MNTKTKTTLLAAAALVMTAGASFAAPGGKWGHGHGHGMNAYERAAIARSAANLASVRHRVWRDGKVSFFERIQLRNAERRHASLVQRARRS
jgi:hypothetical protein